MAQLNRKGGEVFAKGGVHALTDVTGFGLLGHLWNVCEASKVRAVLDFQAIPLMPGIAELAQAGVVPGGSKRNLADVGAHVTFPEAMPEWQRLVLADAQTNGGLLAAVAKRELPKVLAALKRRKVFARVIGSIHKGPAGIEVR